MKSFFLHNLLRSTDKAFENRFLTIRRKLFMTIILMNDTYGNIAISSTDNFSFFLLENQPNRVSELEESGE
jgi:hypothetical protein